MTGPSKPGTPSSQAKPRRRPGRGVLSLIAGMLIASGVLRMGDGVGFAFAVEHETSAQAEVASPDEVAALCSPTTDTSELLLAFQAREARLIERESQIEARLQALRVAESEISEKLMALESAEVSLAATLAIADGAAEDDLAQLTAVYENMKPQDAAALFEQMAPEFSAGFMGRMRPEAAAAIMTNLEPETAYTISVLLAGRNALAPTE